MTEKEAIEKIKQTPLMRYIADRNPKGELGEALEMAVLALERMTPKNPTHKTMVLDEKVFVGFIGNCPNCGCIVDEDDVCCSFCYQVFNWGE